MKRPLYYVTKVNPSKYTAERIVSGCIEDNILLKAHNQNMMIGVALSAGEIQTDPEKVKRFPLFRKITDSAPFDRYVTPCENPLEFDEVIAIVRLRDGTTLCQLEQAETLEAIITLCETFDTAPAGEPV